MEYIGTISIDPRVTVHLGEGMLILKHGDQMVKLHPMEVMALVEDLLKLDESKQQGMRVDGIPIPHNRTRAAINIFLRGLDKLGADTSGIRNTMRQEQETKQERAEGAVLDECEEVGGEGI